MTMRPGLYGYNDLETGDCFETGACKISAELIDDFARVSGDHYAIHMNEAAAKARGFERRVAHGLLVLSVIDGLKNNAAARFDALASMGWHWRFCAPVLEDDLVVAQFTVHSKRLTSAGNRGLVVCQADVHNQDNVLVQTGQNTLIFDL